MVSREQLTTLSRWTGFMGVLTILGGSVSAIMGIFAYILGAIPGIIAIVLGAKLYNVKKYADKMLLAENDEDQKANLSQIFDNLNIYFKALGIMGIVGFGFLILGLLLAIIGGAGILSTLGS